MVSPGEDFAVCTTKTQDVGFLTTSTLWIALSKKGGGPGSRLPGLKPLTFQSATLKSQPSREKSCKRSFGT